MTYPDNFDPVSVKEDGDAVNVESEERCVSSWMACQQQLGFQKILSLVRRQE